MQLLEVIVWVPLLETKVDHNLGELLARAVVELDLEETCFGDFLSCARSCTNYSLEVDGADRVRLDQEAHAVREPPEAALHSPQEVPDEGLVEETALLVTHVNGESSARYSACEVSQGDKLRFLVKCISITRLAEDVWSEVA